jgi:hypothetical protein
MKMEKRKHIKPQGGGLGRLINHVQTVFVGMLRIWSIPIVLLLSIASGFTTFYGLSHFILPWIALIITIAIQSIIVICSLEIAGIHWKANRFRYLTIMISLLIALAASISFSYFKFYEISEQDTIHIRRLSEVQQDVNGYLRGITEIKNTSLEKHRKALEQASKEVSQAFFGTHPEVLPHYKHVVGKGPFWRRYNELYQNKKEENILREQEFAKLDNKILTLQGHLNQLDVVQDKEDVYQKTLANLQEVQVHFNRLTASEGNKLPDVPVLMSYKQFVQSVKPNFSMWVGFSVFAFVCAAMVDFFTVLLSYRLEFTAPGPLTDQEESLVFECLRQFTEFRINENDELEMVIEKTELERARHYSDWSRMFAVGLLLNRGFLRKIDDRTVEFAPNLYPLIAESMGEKLQRLKAQSASELATTEVIHGQD